MNSLNTSGESSSQSHESAFTGPWSPLRQWLISLCILAAALLFQLAGLKAAWPFMAIYVSLLMMACMNPVINALRPNLLRNMGMSVALFGLHAVICYFMLFMIRGEIKFNSQLFMAILVFYAMATMLSMLFRGIYIAISEM